DVDTVLRTGGGRVTHQRTPRWLVSAQFAMSLTLLICAALFVRSVRAGFDTSLGFDPEPLLAMDIEPRLVGYKSAETVQLAEQIVARAVALPGAITAAASQHVPLAP